MSETEEKITAGKNTLPLILSLVVTVAMALLLWGQGRIWWCKSGDLAIYINAAWNSSHTSQHLLDPYTFTHILHGVLFFWITGVFVSRLSIRRRFFVATVAEAAWEVLENSSFIIQQYRENTASLDYFGDSIMNSVGDVLACAAGFWIAYKVGWWRSLILFVLTEICLLLWIRDSLLLNIVMLIFRLDAIKLWQMGA
jgi:Protein of unknown function (DUF2585)